MKRKRHSAEFKREAARLMIMDGQSAPVVASQLGVNPSLLYRWKREHLAELEQSGPGRAGASPTQMAAEIEALRQRLAKAERINQILKKTVSYFAKDE